MGSVQVDPLTGVMKFEDDSDMVVDTRGSNDNGESSSICSKDRSSMEIPSQLDCTIDNNILATNEVTVRWHDGYKEKFTNVTEVRFGSDLLFIRYNQDGKIKNRHIPLRSVRWFGLDEESHEDTITA